MRNKYHLFQSQGHLCNFLYFSLMIEPQLINQMDTEKTHQEPSKTSISNLIEGPETKFEAQKITSSDVIPNGPARESRLNDILNNDTSSLSSQNQDFSSVKPTDESISSHLSDKTSLTTEKDTGQPHPEESIEIPIENTKGRVKIVKEPKEKKSVRGRPRSDTSQRAIKEAKRAAKLKVAFESADVESLRGENGTTTPSKELEMGDSGTIHEPNGNNTNDSLSIVVKSEPTDFLIEDNSLTEIKKESQDQELSSNKRKSESTPTPKESRPKPKKIKKEKFDKKDSPSLLKNKSQSPAIDEKEVYDFVKSKIVTKSKRSSTRYENSDDFDHYCICRKGDTGEWMIGCDFCDDWFHGSCVGLTEESSTILIKYACPRCSKNGTATSIFKRKCRLKDCNMPVEYEEIEGTELRPKSKYCSVEHGILFFKRIIDLAPQQSEYDSTVLTSSELVTFINSCKNVRRFQRLGSAFPNPENIPTEEDIVKSFSVSDKKLVEEYEKRISELESKLVYNSLRLKFITQCKDRAKLIGEELTKESNAVTADEEKSITSTKKKSLQKKTKRDICGYNSKLSLSEFEWSVYIDTSDGKTSLMEDLSSLEHQNRDFVCLNDKRKCKKHSGWLPLVTDSVADTEQCIVTDIEKMKTKRSELYYKQQTYMMTVPNLTDTKDLTVYL